MKTAKKELLKIVAVAAAGVIAGTGVTAATIGAAKKTDGTKARQPRFLPKAKAKPKAPLKTRPFMCLQTPTVRLKR